MLDWFLPNSFRGNYNFHIEVQPKTIESNSNITLTCYSNRNNKSVIPAAINWFRLRNGIAVSLQHVRGNTYMCDPSDVGAVIRAEIRSLDEQSTGTATVDLGPVRIDLLTKKNIESILSTGVGNFTVFLVGRTRDRQASLRINDGVMRLKDIATQNCYKFEYSVADPRVDINPKDNTRIMLRFSERYEEDLMRFLKATFQEDMPQIRVRQAQFENGQLPGDTKLELRFTSRTTKDMLVFSYRAFMARRQIKTSHLLNKIENINLNEEDTFNFLLEIESLKSEIVRMLEMNREQTREKDLYHRQIKRLEEEMERIIMTYTRIVEEKCRNQIDFNQSYSVLTNKRDEVLTRKQRNLEQDNKELAHRNRLLMEELEYLKFGRVPGEMPQLHISQVQHSFTKKSSVPPELDSKVIELSRINSYNERKREKSMENVLESLNESGVRETINQHGNIEQLNESLMALHTKHNAVLQKLEATVRKKEQLEKVVAQQSQELHHSRAVSNGSGNRTSRIEVVHKLPPNANAQSMFVESGELHRLNAEIAELRKVNDKLSHDNSKLQAARNLDLSRCQNLQNEVSALKEDIANADRNRSQYTMIVESTEQQKLKAEVGQLAAIKLGLERRLEALQRENSQLLQRMKTVEFDLECERANTKRLLEANSPELLRLKEENLYLQKRLSDREQALAASEQSLRRAKATALNSSTTSEEPSRLKRRLEELQEENKLLRQGQEVLNRSRDLSMEMDSYYEQENNIVKQQLAMLTEENENLARMVEKYSREAKETTRLRTQIIQLRQENLQLKQELQERSVLSEPKYN